ncbi:histone H3 [Leishmania tarentolae]|uniref:Histone H3 n=1 Tax=Leishmania tarentolae TaxID=5689 RepID=A0A640KC03_LEITA|nr:histone H3 [Leishmania tarentolae]
MDRATACLILSHLLHPHYASSTSLAHTPQLPQPPPQPTHPSTFPPLLHPTAPHHVPHQGDRPREAHHHVEEEQEGAERGVRREEGAPPLAPGHVRDPRDPQVPEEHEPADPVRAVPAPGARGVERAEGGPALPEQRHHGDPGGDGGVRCVADGGHEPRLHPREACDDPAEGHSAGAAPAR